MPFPARPLEERFGRDLAGFWEVGRRLGAERRASGDGALAFPVYPGLPVEVILWVADDEFPAQVSFTVPSGLDPLLATGRGVGPHGVGGERSFCLTRSRGPAARPGRELSVGGFMLPVCLKALAKLKLVSLDG